MRLRPGLHNQKEFSYEKNRSDPTFKFNRWHRQCHRKLVIPFTNSRIANMLARTYEELQNITNQRADQIESDSVNLEGKITCTVD
jgi:hypothetical protein